MAQSQIEYEAGSDADFARLYSDTYLKILKTLTIRLGDGAAAEDCTQEAFERAYRSWKTWKPIAPAEAWVHRIAVNAAISYQRKMKIREAGEIVRRLGRPDVVSQPEADDAR